MFELLNIGWFALVEPFVTMRTHELTDNHRGACAARKCRAVRLLVESPPLDQRWNVPRPSTASPSNILLDLHSPHDGAPLVRGSGGNTESPPLNPFEEVPGFSAPAQSHLLTTHIL
jgi:hypothetical protein